MVEGLVPGDSVTVSPVDPRVPDVAPNTRVVFRIGDKEFILRNLENAHEHVLRGFDRGHPPT